MKTRIEVTWPRATADEIQKLYGISDKRRTELKRIGEEATRQVLAEIREEKAKAKKAKAA